MAAARPREASSISSSVTPYHVFLSFRGKDTRNNFTDHLYTALVDAGIRTFRDNDELVRGESIESNLQKAIQESKISMVVFSQNYASSKCCLDELVRILEHKKMVTHHMILPVFYHVDPAQVRHQLGSFAEAFARHVERLNSKNDEQKREGMEKVEKWKAALHEVANLSGMELQDGQEAVFIQNIVKEIVKKLKRSVLRVPERPIGIDSRVTVISQWVEDGSKDLNIMVIHGMGGIGKTTIAKTVYNLNFDQFEGSSFLANIRDASEQPDGLVCLQGQLLSDVLRGRSEEIYNVEEGAMKIRDALSCKRILLVLDDVDHLDQLNEMLGVRDWFHPGSKIIITTRNKHLLKPHEACELYEVKELNGDESLELFSWHAFGQDHPDEGYLELSDVMLEHCGGVPLALQVIGSFLSGKSVNIWVNQSEKLETIADGDIVKKLRISFDGLPDNDIKNVFLHIACFFVGEKKDSTVKVLDSCDLHTAVAIEHLVVRSLLDIDHDNKLLMHHLIRDMGRDIVRQESPDEPEKRSRLWHPKDCFSVLNEKIGTEAIKALVFDIRMSSIAKTRTNLFEEVHDNPYVWFKFLKRRASDYISWDPMEYNLYGGDFEAEAFTRMNQLKLLTLNYVKLKGSYKDFPKQLRYLCWHGFYLGSIPSDLSLERLVILDMQHSNLRQVWKGNKPLPSLKILNLSHSKWLSRTPNFSGAPNLERLIFKGCISLVYVCESVGFLERLALLDVSDCKSLKELPRNISKLRHLGMLIISGCSSLCEFPTSLRCMESLKEVYADRVSTTGSIPKTKSAQWCLPSCLVKLSLKGCNLSDASFPVDFHNLPVLEYLNLDGSSIRRLPDCIKTLNKLKELHASYCMLLQSVEGLPSSTKTLFASFNGSLERIKPSSNITEIHCFGCYNLLEVEGRYKSVCIENVDKQIMKNLGLLDFQLEEEVVKEIKVRYESGIFSTFIPTTKPVGSLFDYTDRSGSSSISLTILDNSSNKRTIKGLNVCLSYHRCHDNSGIFWNSECKVSNTSKDLHWVYWPDSFAWWRQGHGNYVDGTMLSHWRLGDLLEVGDNVNVEFDMEASVEIKEIGVKVVYEDDENDYDDDDKETSTSQSLSNNDTKKDAVTLSWNEEERNHYHLHLSDCRSSGTQHILHNNRPRKRSGEPQMQHTGYSRLYL